MHFSVNYVIIMQHKEANQNRSIKLQLVCQTCQTIFYNVCVIASIIYATSIYVTLASDIFKVIFSKLLRILKKILLINIEDVKFQSVLFSRILLVTLSIYYSFRQIWTLINASNSPGNRKTEWYFNTPHLSHISCNVGCLLNW